MRPRALVPLVAAATVLSGCGGASSSRAPESPDGTFPTTVTTCGFTSSVPTPPRRIVTLNQAATEVAIALGVADRMVGTAYLDDAVAPRFQAQYGGIPVLAEKYPSQEKVLSVAPDALYASYTSAFAAQAAGGREKWADRDIATVLAPAGCAKKPERASWDLIWDELAAAGTAFGAEEAAARLTVEQRSELTSGEVKDAARGQRVLWWDYAKSSIPNVGAGAGTPQLLIESVGAANVFADRPGNWAEVSMENVIASNPDVIVVADAKGHPAQERIDFARNDPAMRQLRAVREGRFVVIPFSETTSGVRLLDGARRLAHGIRALP